MIIGWDGVGNAADADLEAGPIPSASSLDSISMCWCQGTESGSIRACWNIR
jgi:hypothetical protein